MNMREEALQGASAAAESTDLRWSVRSPAEKPHRKKLANNARVRTSLTVFIATVLAATGAWAETYPSRPVTIINPYAAGSSTDLVARALADEFQKQLGQSFVVVSRDGASGVIGMTALSLAAPDGATLAFSPLTPLTVQPHLVPGTRLGPDAVQPVCGVVENILGIAVNSDSPLKSVEDIIDRARSGTEPNYGSPGANSGPSLGAEDLARSQGVKFNHIPFRGDAGVLPELLAGRLDFATVIAASASPYIKSGKMRLLAVMSNRRHPDFPTVPTLSELKYPVTQLSYAGVFAPKNTPPKVLVTLEQACERAVSSEALRTIATNSNQTLKYQPRFEMEEFVREQYRLQGESLRAAGSAKDKTEK